LDQELAFIATLQVIFIDKEDSRVVCLSVSGGCKPVAGSDKRTCPGDKSDHSYISSRRGINGEAASPPDGNVASALSQHRLLAKFPRSETTLNPFPPMLRG
jgi:hypothetical protein